MKVSDNDLHEATKFYLGEKQKLDATDISDFAAFESGLQVTYGAGRVLTLLGVDIEGLTKRGHCPNCGRYLGRRDPDDHCDPECANCGWMGKI